MRAVVATHQHEEHVGNLTYAAKRLNCPALATKATLDGAANPPAISLPRRTLMGQPQPHERDVELIRLGRTLGTANTSLRVIESPGHCEGHASLYEPNRKILFCGDSFMHTVFTAPNDDDRSDRWRQTLRAYATLDIKTMICGHGAVYTCGPALPDIPHVTIRRNPNALIKQKLAFIEWGKNLVAEGERRGLPYSVIEACVFPWRSFWAYKNWFKAKPQVGVPFLSGPGASQVDPSDRTSRRRGSLQ